MPIPVRKASITAGQIRSARALLNMSQEDLAKKSGLGLSTIRDYENERRGGTGEVGALVLIRSALEREGINFVAGDHTYGPSVKLNAVRANVLRWPDARVLRGDVQITVEWRGSQYVIIIPEEAKDDLGGFNDERPLSDYAALLEGERVRIEIAAARAVDNGRAQPDGRVYLSAEDIKQAVQQDA